METCLAWAGPLGAHQSTSERHFPSGATTGALPSLLQGGGNGVTTKGHNSYRGRKTKDGGRGSKVTGKLQCHDCQRMISIQAVSPALGQRAEGLKAASFYQPSCLRFRCKGDRAQEGSQPSVGSPVHDQRQRYLPPNLASGMWGPRPPLPACGTIRGPGWDKLGKTRTGLGMETKIFSNLASKQSKFKEQKP